MPGAAPPVHAIISETVRFPGLAQSNQPMQTEKDVKDVNSELVIKRGSVYSTWLFLQVKTKTDQKQKSFD